MVLTTVLSMMRYVSEIEDRDFVDRLNSFFTTNLLIGLSVLVSFKQFGGKPLECLTPDIFSGSWEEDTYFVSPHAIVDGIKPAVRRQRRISYYQWVPFFLLLEAVCFRLPSILWKYMSGHSGIKIREIGKLASDPNNIKPDIRRANIRSLTTHLQGALRFHRRVNRKQIRPHGSFWLLNLPYSARYVTCMYILTKFAYLLNVFAQLALMNSFLETHRYSFYGFGAMLDLLNGTTWEQSGMFPRVSLCDFEVRVMGNIQEYTIQCVLVVNIFNEKIFIFLWFWYLFVLLLTVGSFLFWFGVSVLPCFNRSFITRHLEMGELSFDAEANEKLIDRFVGSYLRADGVFVIRMITFNSGVIFGTDLVLSLWQSYNGIEFYRLKRGNSFPELSEMPLKGAESEDETFDAEIGRSSPVPIRDSLSQLRQRHANMVGSQGRRMPRLADGSAARIKANETVLTPPPMPAAVLRAVAGGGESGGTTRTHSPPTPPDVALSTGQQKCQQQRYSAKNEENERLLQGGTEPSISDGKIHVDESSKLLVGVLKHNISTNNNSTDSTPVVHTMVATPTDVLTAPFGGPAVAELTPAAGKSAYTNSLPPQRSATASHDKNNTAADGANRPTPKAANDVQFALSDSDEE